MTRLTEKLFQFFPLLVAVFHFCAGSCFGIRYEVKDVGFRNSIYFVSDAPLETIVGITNFISGWLDFDPGNLKEGVKGVIEVDTRTFETGMPARNVKVRELFLGSSKQPIATFTLSRWAQISAPILKQGSTVTGRAEGVLSLNGVEVKTSLPIRITSWKEGPMTKKRLSGNLMQMRSDFQLRLSDFRIPIPAAFQGIVSPEVKFSVHIFGTDRVPSSTTP